MFKGAGLAIIHTDECNNHYVLLGKSNIYNTWVFPGGGKEKDEQPCETAYREFIEEVFNVCITKEIVTEIIDLINQNKNCFSIDTKISNNKDIPSYTFIQKDNCITIMVNVLSKYNIYSNVFNIQKFKKSNTINYYENLYDNKKQINIYNFCSMRRYITEKPYNSINEIVFIIMIPLNNILSTIDKNENFHYHFEYLKLTSPYIFPKINKLLNNNNKIIINPELLNFEQLMIV